jgi:hypothetical protein
VQTDSGVTYVSGIQPGVNAWIDVVARNGHKTRLVVLAKQEAENAWKVRMDGEEHLLITPQDLFTDADQQASPIVLHERDHAEFVFTLMPPLQSAPTSTLPLTATATTAQFVSYAATAKAKKIDLQMDLLKPAGVAPPVKLAPPPAWRKNGVAQAPDAGDLPAAALWSITVPAHALNGLSELFLEVRYQGDVARLTQAGRLLSDDFYNGLAWPVGLRRFMDASNATKLQLSILPQRQDAPIYFETPKPIQFAPNGQAVQLDNLRLVPEYQMILNQSTNQNLRQAKR